MPLNGDEVVTGVGVIPNIKLLGVAVVFTNAQSHIVLAQNVSLTTWPIVPPLRGCVTLVPASPSTQ